MTPIRLRGKTFVLGEDFADLDGHLADWFRRHGATAVVVRPDFYTYGVASGQASTSKLVEALARDLFLMFQPEGALTQ